MTVASPLPASSPPRSVVAEAEAMADAADDRAGIRTRPARPDELATVLARFEATWGVGRGPDRSMLQALEHAGNTVLIAVPRSDDADALGATLGFLGWSSGLHLHSHMNAVDPAARGRGIGVALKLRQRAVCLAHGVDTGRRRNGEKHQIDGPAQSTQGRKRGTSENFVRPRVDRKYIAGKSVEGEQSLVAGLVRGRRGTNHCYGGWREQTLQVGS